MNNETKYLWLSCRLINYVVPLVNEHHDCFYYDYVVTKHLRESKYQVQIQVDIQDQDNRVVVCKVTSEASTNFYL